LYCHDEKKKTEGLWLYGGYQGPIVTSKSRSIKNGLEYFRMELYRSKTI